MEGLIEQDQQALDAPATSTTNPSIASTLRLDISNTKTLLALVRSLYNDHSTSDLTLVSGQNEREFRVHRLLLTQSPVLQTMLYGEHWSESTMNRIVLNESPEYDSYLELFISYLYNQPITICMDNIAALVYYADKYSVEKLLGQCVEYFQTQVETYGDLSAAIHSCRIMRALLQTSPSQVDKIRSVVLENIEMIFCENSVLSIMDYDDIKSILSSDAIVCRTEFTLYKLLENWLIINPDEENRFAVFKELINFIRSQFMHIQELAYLEKSSPRLFQDASRQTEATNIIKVLLCDSYKYHLLSRMERRQMILPSTRRYTDIGSCMRFTLSDTYALGSWAKVEQYFEIKNSISKADSTHLSFRVTLMRKMTACNLVAEQNWQREHAKSVLSLEITQLTNEPLTQSEAVVYVQTRRGPRTMRRWLTCVPINMSNSRIQSDILNYDDIVSKDSIYKYSTTTASDIYLALDIILN